MKFWKASAIVFGGIVMGSVVGALNQVVGGLATRADTTGEHVLGSAEIGAYGGAMIGAFFVFATGVVHAMKCYSPGEEATSPPTRSAPLSPCMTLAIMAGTATANAFLQIVAAGAGSVATGTGSHHQKINVASFETVKQPIAAGAAIAGAAISTLFFAGRTLLKKCCTRAAEQTPLLGQDNAS